MTNAVHLVKLAFILNRNSKRLRLSFCCVQSAIKVFVRLCRTVGFSANLGPFLRIVRTGRIVTHAERAYRRIHRSFPHMARFINVTTTVNFIVTAGLLWGFVSELSPLHLTFQ